MYILNHLKVNNSNHLEIGGCDAVELAKEYGTPLYVMDEDRIRSNMRDYKNAIDSYYNGNGKAYFASKALSAMYMYKLASEEGLGADVVSGGELYTALKAGFDAKNICFHGNNKSYEEIKMAVENGANEVDIVLAHNAFLDGNYAECSREISEIKKTIGDAHLKVILESGSLPSSEDIAKASFLSMEAGADFIKTSTGKTSPAATPEAAVVMCECIKLYYKATGRKIGFKPAGGIVTAEDAALFYGIVDTILGEEWLNKELFRFGASRMANNLLTEIVGSEVKYY